MYAGWTPALILPGSTDCNEGHEGGYNYEQSREVLRDRVGALRHRCLGDHYVAVRPSAVKLGYDAKDSKWHATMDANAGQLKSSPEYKYPRKT